MAILLLARPLMLAAIVEDGGVGWRGWRVSGGRRRRGGERGDEEGFFISMGSSHTLRKSARAVKEWANDALSEGRAPSVKTRDLEQDARSRSVQTLLQQNTDSWSQEQGGLPPDDTPTPPQRATLVHRHLIVFSLHRAQAHWACATPAKLLVKKSVFDCQRSLGLMGLGWSENLAPSSPSSRALFRREQIRERKHPRTFTRAVGLRGVLVLVGCAAAPAREGDEQLLLKKSFRRSAYELRGARDPQPRSDVAQHVNFHQEGGELSEVQAASVVGAKEESEKEEGSSKLGQAVRESCAFPCRNLRLRGWPFSGRVPRS